MAIDPPLLHDSPPAVLLWGIAVALVTATCLLFCFWRRRNAFTAYTLWAMTGCLGLHLLYLGRPYQWLLYISSLGGCGFASLTDLFLIPSYLRTAVSSPPHSKQAAWAESTECARGVSWLTLLGGVILIWVFSCWYEGLTRLALDGYVPLLCAVLCQWLARAVAIVTCFGAFHRPSSVRFVFPVVCAVESLVQIAIGLYTQKLQALTFFSLVDAFDIPHFFSVLCTCIAVYRQTTRAEGQKKKKKPQRPCATAAFVTVTAVTLIALSSSAAYNHITFEFEFEGVRVTSLKQLLESPVMDQLKDEIEQMFRDVGHAYQQNGFWAAYETAYKTLHSADDSTPTSDDYQVLGLELDATDAEIRSRYRHLARKHHPDKDSDGNAANTMAKINTSYERLTRRAKRQRDEL